MTAKEALDILTTLNEAIDMDDYMQAVDVLEQALTELEELKEKAHTLLLGLNAEPSDRDSQEYQKWQGDIVDAMNGLNKLVGDKDE